MDESVHDRRRVVVSIHGIRSEGKWQDEFKEVFEPHFRFISFKYGEFNHSIGAVLWIALELWVVVFSAVALWLAWGFGWLHEWQQWIIAFLLILLGFIAATASAVCGIAASNRGWAGFPGIRQGNSVLGTLRR